MISSVCNSALEKWASITAWEQMTLDSFLMTYPCNPSVAQQFPWSLPHWNKAQQGTPNYVPDNKIQTVCKLLLWHRNPKILGHQQNRGKTDWLFGKQLLSGFLIWRTRIRLNMFLCCLRQLWNSASSSAQCPHKNLHHGYIWHQIINMGVFSM